MWFKTLLALISLLLLTLVGLEQENPYKNPTSVNILVIANASRVSFEVYPNLLANCPQAASISSPLLLRILTTIPFASKFLT